MSTASRHSRAKLACGLAELSPSSFATGERQMVKKILKKDNTFFSLHSKHVTAPIQSDIMQIVVRDKTLICVEHM